MCLSFEEKETIFDSYKELKKSNISYERVNYRYKGKVIVTQLYKRTGNGYIRGEFLNKDKYDIYPRKWIKIKYFREKEIRALIEKVIKSFDSNL